MEPPHVAKCDKSNDEKMRDVNADDGGIGLRSFEGDKEHYGEIREEVVNSQLL